MHPWGFGSWSAAGRHEDSSAMIRRSIGHTNGRSQRPRPRSFWTGIEAIGDRLRGIECRAFLVARRANRTSDPPGARGCRVRRHLGSHPHRVRPGAASRPKPGATLGGKLRGAFERVATGRSRVDSTAPERRDRRPGEGKLSGRANTLSRRSPSGQRLGHGSPASGNRYSHPRRTSAAMRSWAGIDLAFGRLTQRTAGSSATSSMVRQTASQPSPRRSNTQRSRPVDR